VADEQEPEHGRYGDRQPDSPAKTQKNDHQRRRNDEDRAPVAKAAGHDQSEEGRSRKRWQCGIEEDEVRTYPWIG
jgi:hypothetical protein